MPAPWLGKLRSLVELKPLTILRFEKEEWESLENSRRGVGEFTVARSHHLIETIKAPCACLFHGPELTHPRMYFGVVSSKTPVTTLDSRIRVHRGVQISPATEAELLELMHDSTCATNLRNRLISTASAIHLSPKLSSYLVERLAEILENQGAMRAVAESLSSPKKFKGTAALQEDAVRTALSAFGLSSNDRAITLELVEGKETALGRVGIMEDSVVEHDARTVPGYKLVQSDVTGRAVFHSGDERLEVFTANRRELEHCFGVDLIYLNLTKQNLIMLQYKMLNPEGKFEDETDWIYRPDDKLDEEIERMKKFGAVHPAGALEYRLNPAVFYLKFVKRDGALSNGGIITPLDHFEKLRIDPVCVGPKGGLRVSYNTLRGNYLRQGAFLDLLRSGYIGAHAETTAHLTALIDEILKSNKAVVAAIQTSIAVP